MSNDVFRFQDNWIKFQGAYAWAWVEKGRPLRDPADLRMGQGVVTCRWMVLGLDGLEFLT